MKRSTFDALVASAGFAVAVLLLVGGGLLTWGHSFVHHQVRSQLAAEKIYFPAKGDPALASPQIGPYLDKYAGQQMVDGAQARAWANHFIAVHLQEIGGGKTYAQLSAESIAHPNNAALAAQVNTMFKGETLRRLLLNAYAFDGNPRGNRCHRRLRRSGGHASPGCGWLPSPAQEQAERRGSTQPDPHGRQISGYALIRPPPENAVG